MQMIRDQEKKQIVSLHNRRIDDSEIKKLLEQSKSQSIAKLGLSGNQITFVGINYFKDKQWNHLTHLFLTNNKIGNVGCKNLSRAQFASLEQLWLGGNHIQNAGLHHLSKAQFKKLKKMWLSENLLQTNTGLKPNWKNFQEIIMGYNELTLSGVLQVLLIQPVKLSYASFTNNKFNDNDKIRIRTLMQAKFPKIQAYV